MKAEEARDLMLKSIQEEVDTINSYIRESASKGYAKLTITKLTSGVVSYLKSEGFEIEEMTSGSDSVFTISW